MLAKWSSVLFLAGLGGSVWSPSGLGYLCLAGGSAGLLLAALVPLCRRAATPRDARGRPLW